jgi:hypothetical protein
MSCHEPFSLPAITPHCRQRRHEPPRDYADALFMQVSVVYIWFADYLIALLLLAIYI